VNLSRRQLMIGAGAVALAAVAAGFLWQRGSGPGPAVDSRTGNVNPAALYTPSVTCPACAAFHNESYPTLKSKYIETGRVRYIFREFPTQPAQVAVAGFMLARCSGDNYFAFIEALFEQQRVWAADPGNGLMRIARQAGFSEESFTNCLKDEKLALGIQEIAERGFKMFEVKSTPTFFINGQRYVGVLTTAQLEGILESAR
jgi:protein-disulfide isomerase